MTTHNIKIIVSAGLALLISSFTSASAAAAEEVNVYSYRKPELIQPLFNKFTDQSGIKVNVVSAKKGLVERLKQEGTLSPADIVFTVDIGRLSDVKTAGLTQPMTSDVLNTNIPPQYRDPEGHWFGLTTRGRIVVVSKDRVADGDITTYEGLADPKFKGKICTRSGKHVYMVGLIASMIAHNGEAATQQWLAGLKDNLARKPQGNDRAQAKAIAAGECDIAIINTYYLGKMATNKDQLAWYEAVKPIFPNQDGRGAHLNIAGMALTKHAPNKDNAMKLMEFLSTEEAQQIYARDNHEYPVKDGVARSDVVSSWGNFKADTVGLAAVASYRAAASKLVDIVDFDR